LLPFHPFFVIFENFLWVSAPKTGLVEKSTICCNTFAIFTFCIVESEKNLTGKDLMPENEDLDKRSDEQLIAAVLKGDTPSYGVIVERYWKMAVALALSKINDAIEAEDIAQESFIKAYSQLHKLRNPDRFAGWLSKIVTQLCINHVRRYARSQKVITLDMKAFEALDSGLAFSSNPGLDENQISFIRGTVAKLPDKFKKVVIMRFVAGFTSAEIAKKLGKRHGTVRVWLHRAYEILRKELVPLFEEVKEL
jgi:RNA polymerase sigma-70 factor (ECF subfamily)